MTDDEIRQAACAAYNEASRAMLIHSEMLTEGALVCLDAVYRAGMAAERARCIAIAEVQVYGTPDGCRTVAYLRAHDDGVHSVVDALKAPTKGE
jgi:hypothetical protein